MLCYLFLFLSLASVLVAQPNPVQNASLPWAIFHTALNTLNSRSWPDCAWDVHAVVGHGQSKVFYQFGGQSATFGTSWSNINWRNDFDFSSNPTFGYSYTSTIVPTFNYNFTGQFTGYNPISRVAGMTAVMTTGTVIDMAGKCAPNWAWQNDVIYSTDKGRSWSLATANAAFTPRSDAVLAVAPGTNNVVMAGGEGQPGYLSDVWLSTDGIGAVWTLQNAAPFMKFQQGAMTFLYDATPSQGATLVLYNPSDNNIWHSLDLGKTWTMISSMSVQGEDPQQTGRMVADVENYLYMAGGAQIGPQVYFSIDKGYTWQQLTQTNFYPGVQIADPITVNNFQYGCLAINYVAATSAPNGYHKQMIEYGGYLTAQQDINSWYGCQTTSGIASYTSVLAELVFPGETVTTFVEGSVPPNGGNSVANATMIFHDAADQLIYRAYSDWTSDVHAVITRNSSVRMWQFGGFDMNWGFIPSTDYTPNGNWNQFSTFTSTYNSNGYPTPSGRVAAGVGLLYNNNLLMFGGKDSNSTQWVNDVYYSTDNGYSYTLSTYNAPWSARSDMVVAVMPGTNIIVMGGGQGPPSGGNVQDWWYSTDGKGAVWQKGATTTAFGLFQNAAFVAMYDNKAVSSSFSNQYSTLFVNPGIIAASNADGIYKSIDAGASWTFVMTAPWTQRIRGIFIADMENYLYMLGGWPSNYGDIWVSTDMSGTWTFLRQNPWSNIWPNTFSFQSAQQNAVALRYAANPASPNGYHKQLVLYGGGANPANGLLSIQVSQRPAPSCIRTVPVNVVYAEIMFPSEMTAAQNGQWTDTLSTSAVQSNTPQIAFNSPTPLLTYRQYSACAADVHAAMNGATPMSYSLGGWDINSNNLPTLDAISGSNINSYTYISPIYGRGFSSAMGRTAGIAAVLANGNIIWGGGKTGPSNVYNNDVWFSWNQGQNWNLSTNDAPWAPRSDAATAAIPGTNCLIVTGGQGVQVVTGNFETAEIWFNDVWTSCDGYGQQWTQQTAAAPFGTAQQAAIVALYDNTGSSTNPTNTIVYYSWVDQYIRSSNNMGKTWVAIAEAAWSQRFARFVADLNNNIYMAGGMNPNGNNGDSSNYNNGIGDTWWSSNKGLTWSRLTPTTTAGYSNPVTLSTASYSCATLLYTGTHRSIMLYSNWIEVYSSQNAMTTGRGGFGTSTPCICDSLTGIRGVIGDLLFPGESVNTVSSGGSSTSYSAGQTAGIAVGVGVGVALLCCLAVMFLMGGRGLTGKDFKGEQPMGKAKATKFEDEPSATSQSVEMGTA